MGTALIKIKIMPTSPDIDLEKIKNSAHSVISENKGSNIMFDEEPIAFGLKAVIAAFDISEDDPMEPLEEALRKIENVNSAEVIDMRRAFG
ncbi:elongation factor 1-beta [Candidatus Babeliales bacterium]|nr:elongation factor 1-beta [Candidatus Babeliales bacterium]MCF7910145.1 elongation factor 1-beta [Candidatus Pacearchaeota archaeon]